MDRGATADARTGGRTIDLTFGKHANVTTMDVTRIDPLNEDRPVQEVEVRLAPRMM
jgi:hypothetical protein